MLTDVMRTWEKKEGRSSFSRITDSARKAPLRERISYTIYRLKIQNRRLEQAGQRMQSHYNKIFRKCTNAVMGKDNVRASMYANECAEIKKMCQTIISSEFAIEQLVLRLETIEEFGDIVVEMAPVAGVITSLRSHLSGIVPEVSFKLGEIGDSLNDIVTESGGATAMTLSIGSSSEESEHILNDANAIAEQKMKEKFPLLPSADLPTLEKTP